MQQEMFRIKDSLLPFKITLLLLTITLTGCQQGSNAFERKESGNDAQEIEYIELASHTDDWDDIEFSVGLEQFSPPETVRRITTAQDAIQFGEELIENYPRKGDLVLKTVVYFKDNNTWRFDYYSSKADQDTEHGGLFVVADGSSATIIKAWVEE